MANNRRALWTVGLAVAVLALSLGAACGKKSSESKATGTSTPPKAATAVEKANEKSAGAAAKAGDDSAEFAALFGRYKNAEVRIDYEFSMTGAGAMSGTMSIRQSGNKSRFDMTAAQGSMIMIQLPDKSYMCITDQRMCLESPAAGAPGGNPMVSAVQDLSNKVTGYSIRKLDSRKIAGVDGRCFEYTAPNNEKGTLCVGPDGQMLLIEVTSGGQTWKMTATKVEGKPPASDFDPPYPVMAMPGGFGMPGGPGALPTVPAR
jgi:hypothetical protein